MDKRTKRDGLIYLVLAVGGMATPLWMAVRFHLQVAGTVVSLVPSMAGLYLSWAAFRAARGEAEQSHRDRPGDIADLLAAVVRGQWESEVQRHRMNDPYPLPVAWRAEEEPAESWSMLTDMAEQWPAGVPGDPDGWAADASALAGSGAQIIEVFLDRLPTRRLLVLGEPGTGKSMLLVRLLLSLIDRRAPGGAVPVLFPLSSWDPAGQPLEDWMAQRLTRDYAGLGDSGQATRLLRERLILPVLDGFDELPAPVRGMALDLINAALPLGQPVVLSSRVGEYRDTLLPAGGVPVRLSGAAAITLEPLAIPDVAAYLRRDAGGHHTAAADRWEPVIAALGSGAPVAQVLRTPLMLFLARTAYNPRPGEYASGLPDPAGLCDTGRFPAPADIRRHLFDAFISAAYRPHPLYPCRWSPRRAERALTGFAQHLLHDLDGTTDLAWWHFHRMLPRRFSQLVAGLVLGAWAWLTADLVGQAGALVTHLGNGWSTGPSAAVVGGLAGGIAGGLGCGLAAGATAGAAEGTAHAYLLGQPDLLLTVGCTGLAYGFAGGLVGALSSRLAAHRRGRSASPWAGWRWDWRGFVTGSAGGGALWFALRPVFGPWAALVGASVNAALYGVAGGALGSVASALSANRRSAPAMRTHWSWDWRAFRVCLASGPALGCIYWAVLTVQTALTGIAGYAFTAMLPFICAYGLTLGLACGLKSKQANLAGAVGPTTLLLQDRRTFRKLWIVVGGTVCAAFLLCFGVAYASHTGPLYGLSYSTSSLADLPVTPANILTTGLTYGLTIGLAAGLSQTAGWTYLVARSYLFLRRGLPWHLTAFLADAHESRGVLRQVGAAYQFSHIDLQHHLAASARPRLPRTPRSGIPGPRSGTSARSRRPGSRS